MSDCDIESGDDGIVLKSSYNLNKSGCCDNIYIADCRIKSRCNAIKFGMESNGAFKNITISDISIRQTRITGISIESVDGAQIDNINISNVTSAFFLNYTDFLYNVPPVFCNICVIYV